MRLIIFIYKHDKDVPVISIHVDDYLLNIKLSHSVGELC